MGIFPKALLLISILCILAGSGMWLGLLDSGIATPFYLWIAGTFAFVGFAPAFIKKEKKRGWEEFGFVVGVTFFFLSFLFASFIIYHIAIDGWWN